jgi:hypothetical protein
MAYITKDYYEFLKENGIITRNDYTNLVQLSRQAGLKNGKGYTRQTFMSIIKNGNTCTDEVAEFIRGYYEPKVEALKAQFEAVVKMRKSLEQKKAATTIAVPA